ncbi:MAG: hypothetical protein HP493_14920 [Nitrospira sp.]|nr:hypothetical protein [Nitrospira sp.]
MSLDTIELILIIVIATVGYILYTFAKSRNSVSSSSRDVQKVTDKEWQQIVIDFGRYIEDNPSVGAISDSSCLPHPKQAIKEAFVRELLSEADEYRFQCMKATLLALAEFQDGVGSEPLLALGVDYGELKNTDVKTLAERIATYPHRERYEQFEVLVNKETSAIQELLAKVTVLRAKRGADGN